ncbi:hypothetical protein A1O3_01679 [Capronia epimyces CBS 606.96]|uniref:Uncharacterized protein n=1 Tax=Capronia epimyces CBS 606.96 TaxID=1182542 RepID=W9YJN7_9EURO|nr:uncharacterized protein A1O3_01679 [Capronia epimyces CBS 606.96]EXJ93122.1 hypothetical protein A1O3_01679 [Capronia epimyces CBS 606.96]
MPQVRIRQEDGVTVSKWVDINYDAKVAASASNGGILPFSPALYTSDFPHKSVWSKENLPEVLLYLEPPPSRYSGIKVEPLLDNGVPVLGDGGTPLRALEVLPRHISVDVEGWLVETWRRIDSRIRYSDILDRMVADPTFGGIGLKKPSPNILQNNCGRGCRKLLNTWTGHINREEPHRTEVEAIEELTSHHLTYNTVLDVSELFPTRLVKVKLVQRVDYSPLHVEKYEVSVTNWQHTTLPLDHFIRGAGPRVNNGMDNAKLTAWELLLVLQERARNHDLQHWSKLPNSCLPVTWFERTRNKQEPNDTFDGGCDLCTWSSDYAAATPEVDSAKQKTNTTQTKRRAEDNEGDSAPKRLQTAAPPAQQPQPSNVVQHSWVPVGAVHAPVGQTGLYNTYSGQPPLYNLPTNPSMPHNFNGFASNSWMPPTANTFASNPPMIPALNNLDSNSLAPDSTESGIPPRMTLSTLSTPT